MLNIPNLEKMRWEDQRVYLRAFFIDGRITSASRKELEWFLVILANTPPEQFKEETERYESVVSHLLQVRISEELHVRSVRWSVIAIVISSLAAFGTLWQAFRGK